MGDRRFEAAYRTVVEARDGAAAIRSLSDDELVHALAAASRKMDAYLANVLASELLNRQHRRRSLTVGVVTGAAAIVLLRTLAILASDAWDRELLLTSTLALVAGAAIGAATYLLMRRAPAG